MEVQIGNTQLRVYVNGTIERLDKRCNKWSVVKGTNHNGYLRIGIDDKKYLMHRIVAHVYLGLDLNSKLQVDHIDRNGTNNNVSNLRIVTHQENMLNRNITEDAKGYYVIPSGNYRVMIEINGKLVSVGTYQTEYDAVRRYTYESEKINRLRMVK